MQKKASMTVEAALLCPILCLMICGMILFTLRLYGTIGHYAEELQQQQEPAWTATELIRIEAVIEDVTGGTYAE